MAYTTPTAANIKARFPQYQNVADETIDDLITEAKRYVDETWLEDDYAIAIKYLVAHLLETEGVDPETGETGSAASSPGPVTSESLGDASVTYGSRSSRWTELSVADAELATTVWGTRYLNIRRANNAGPVVI